MVIPVAGLGCIDTPAVQLEKIVEILVLVFESKYPPAWYFRKSRWMRTVVGIFTNHEELDSDLRKEFEVPVGKEL